MKLSEAQLHKLACIPDEWAIEPTYGDMRPVKPLAVAGMIERRSTDVTPADWEPSPARYVRLEWRITEAGRQALSTGSKTP